MARLGAGFNMVTGGGVAALKSTAEATSLLGEDKEAIRGTTHILSLRGSKFAVGRGHGSNTRILETQKFHWRLGIFDKGTII